MMVCVQVGGLAFSAMCAAVLAGVTIALEYGVSPSYVWLGLTQYLLLLGYASSPTGGFIACTLPSTLNCCDQKLLGLSIVPRDEAWDAKALAVHMRLDNDWASTSALAKMLTLVFSNPTIYAAIVCAAMITGVGFANRPTHSPYGIRFNRGLQSKWGELLETRPTRVEGNQQPSQKYTSGRFRDYRSGSVRLITGTSAPRESDDIVHARRNAGSRVNGLKFNSATLIKSRYTPGSAISGAATTDSSKVANEFVQFTSGNVLTAYPTITTETLWWINARKPYICFYISSDPEFGFGFTGFKPAQGNTKVAGQVLFAGALAVNPRYHAQLYGISG